MFAFELFDEFVASVANGNGAEWPSVSMRLNLLLDHIWPMDNPRVLDVAAESSVYAVQLAWASTQVEAQSQWRIVAGVTNESQGSVIRSGSRALSAQQHIESVHLLNLPHLQFDASTFDVVYALGPFFELQDRKDRYTLIAEIERVLKPGGVALCTFKMRRAAVARVIADSTKWNSDDDLMHLALFSHPDRYGEIETPASLGSHYYALADEIDELFSTAGLEYEQVVPIDALIGWLPASVWNRVRDLGHAALNTVLTLDDILAFDSTMVGMAGELFCVGRKPEKSATN